MITVINVTVSDVDREYGEYKAPLVPICYLSCVTSSSRNLAVVRLAPSATTGATGDRHRMALARVALLVTVEELASEVRLTAEIVAACHADGADGILTRDNNAPMS